jgi:hypothetical protein
MGHSTRQHFINSFKRALKIDLSIDEYKQLLNELNNPKFAEKQKIISNNLVKYFIFSFKGFSFGVIYDTYLERLISVVKPIKAL